jgi:hypothetical protein
MKALGGPGWAAGCLLQVLLVAGCVAPSTDSGAFRANAVAALASAVGEARTAALALDARADDQATNPYTDTVVTDSESALGPIQDSFGNVDPPEPKDDALRDSVVEVLGDTADACAKARIAVRRDDPASMRSAAGELRELADRMEALGETLR